MKNISNNGFGNTKSLTEQINDIKNSEMSRREKINALIKLGIMANEVSVLLPSEPRVVTPRFTFTFGVEIECIMPRYRFEEVARRDGVPYHFESYNHTDNREYFKFTTDSSLRRSPNREGSPIECVSPVLDGTNEGYSKLSACCKALNEAGAYVNTSTGLHVHIGASSLTDEQYVNVFKNYQALESIIDSFMAPSRRNGYYCASIARYNYTYCENRRNVENEMNSDRYHKVNPISYRAHGTIEFRQHQGTTNYTKIKHWVAFCAKLVAYSMNHVIENVTSIDEIPFLTAAEKRYFNSRKAAFEGGRVREAA